ncbi:MAG: hypothetical protein HY906_22975 [Deltaproteobacteria bacterium]|nr:hypothetical protein [Deltaproteobacteria bacterium]
MSRIAPAALALVLALSLGCRESNNPGQHDASIDPHGDGGVQQDANNNGDGGGTFGTIKAAREANLAAFAPVTIETAVVTGVNWSSTTAKAYIQDAAGGPKSGIMLYCKYASGGTCPMGDAMKALKMGQKVKVVGTWDVYNGQEEIKPTAVTVLDSNEGALPPYAEISAAQAVETLTQSDYEGCLVKISGVSATTPLTVTSMTPAGFVNDNYNSTGACCCGPPYSAFEVSDSSGNKIAVTTNFYRNIDLGTDGTCIMIFDGGVPADKLVVVGDKFNMLAGILDMDPYDMNGITLTPTAGNQYEYVPAGDHDGGL